MHKFGLGLCANVGADGYCISMCTSPGSQAMGIIDLGGEKFSIGSCVCMSWLPMTSGARSPSIVLSLAVLSIAERLHRGSSL